jgi:C1A family cysteine protease
MLAVGYSDMSKSFIVRNSWGVEWVNEYLYLEEEMC